MTSTSGGKAPPPQPEPLSQPGSGSGSDQIHQNQNHHDTLLSSLNSLSITSLQDKQQVTASASRTGRTSGATTPRISTSRTPSRVSSPLPASPRRQPSLSNLNTSNNNTSLRRQSSINNLNNKAGEQAPLSPRQPIRRQASSGQMSLDARGAPTLLRKASMNSLKNANGGGNNSANMGASRNSPSRRSSYGGSGGHAQMYGHAHSPLNSKLGVEEEKIPVTAQGLANEYFEAEMKLHYTTASTNAEIKNEQTEKTDKKSKIDAETVVILHDACFGHRFSRPKTSKNALSTIVERPERVHASILGVSAAYVKLGERYIDGKYAITPDLITSLNDSEDISVPFHIQKSSRKLHLQNSCVTNVHGSKWMEELVLMCITAEEKLAANGKELVRPEMPLKSGREEENRKFHEGDLYLCSESLNAMEGALGAVCDGVDNVFSDEQKAKRAFVVIRPPGHHCSASYPSGFCWINNVLIGINYAAMEHNLTHAAIIDFDLHHGDGSQDIVWEHNENRKTKAGWGKQQAWKKTAIGYFSLHDINSYPCENGDRTKVQNASLCVDNAHGQSVWNVHLQPYHSIEEFWALYESRYVVLLEKTRNFLKNSTNDILRGKIGRNVQPKAAIFLSAGFDASEWESEGMQRHGVNVPTEFYARLARDVRKISEEEGTSVKGRIISVLEGGYSDRALCSGVFAHVSGLAGADPDVPRATTPFEPSRLGNEVAARLGSLSFSETPVTTTPSVIPVYDPTWWARDKLEELEETLNPSAPPPPKPVTKPTPEATYYASTQSFDAKIAESPVARRTSANLFSTSHGPSRRTSLRTSSSETPRAPSPPPPEVGWAVAARELSRVLIPGDRQTYSCKPEELGAAATRERKERQSLLITPLGTGVVSPEPTPAIRKSTRERKPRAVDTAAEERAKEAAAARASRRKTVAGAAVLAAGAPTATASRPSVGRSSTSTSSSGTARQGVSRRQSIDSVMTDAPALPTRAAGPISATPSADGSTETASTMTRRVPASRPGTSATIRPESSVSMRGTTPSSTGVPPVPSLPRSRSTASVAGGPTRKPRAPATTKPIPAAAKLVARKPVATKLTSGTGPMAVKIEKSGDGMDALTSGMQGVNIALQSQPKPQSRITLITKAQREAREAAAREAAAREAADRQARDSAAAALALDAIKHEVVAAPAVQPPQLQPAFQPQAVKVEREVKQEKLPSAMEYIQQQLAAQYNDPSPAAMHSHPSPVQKQPLSPPMLQQAEFEYANDAVLAQLPSMPLMQSMAPPSAPPLTSNRPGSSGRPGCSGLPGTSGSAAAMNNLTGMGGSSASPRTLADRIAKLSAASNIALPVSSPPSAVMRDYTSRTSSVSSGVSGAMSGVSGGGRGMTREQLPKFSATGPIPFAVASVPKVEVKKEGNGEVDVYDVPETPRK